MIPKEKLALLIAGIKPKVAGEKDDEDAGSGAPHERELGDVADKMMRAFKDQDTDALKDALMDLHDCLRGEDDGEDEG